MNPKLIPVLEKLIARDIILQSFKPDNLPQSALAYIRHTYVMCRSLSWEEHDLIEMLPALSDNRSESIRPGGGIGNPDASVYHLFQDGSLWLKTNA
jgi:hypothetical protein